LLAAGLNYDKTAFPSGMEKMSELLFIWPLRCFLIIHSVIWIMMPTYFIVAEGNLTIKYGNYRQKCTSTERQIELLVQFHSLWWATSGGEIVPQHYLRFKECI